MSEETARSIVDDLMMGRRTSIGIAKELAAARAEIERMTGEIKGAAKKIAILCVRAAHREEELVLANTDAANEMARANDAERELAAASAGLREHRMIIGALLQKLGCEAHITDQQIEAFDDRATLETMRSEACGGIILRIRAYQAAKEG
jgi:hypothetical protein